MFFKPVMHSKIFLTLRKSENPIVYNWFKEIRSISIQQKMYVNPKLLIFNQIQFKLGCIYLHMKPGTFNFLFFINCLIHIVQVFHLGII